MAYSRRRHAPRPVLALSAAILLGSTLLLSSCSPGETEPSPEEAPSDAAEQREFPPFVYNSAQTLEAYRTAVHIAEVLPMMPCYCNCGQAHGHTSLKDCFFKEDGSFNDHGAFCEICDGEVADIAQWQEEGYTLERVRELIDEKYPAWGEPTDTPNPFGPEDSSTGEAPSTVEPTSESWAADFSGGPRIAFREQRVEIGRWPFDVPIDYSFHFKNVGDEPLEISRVLARALAGCCAPQPVVSSTTLQPGEEGTLLVGDKPHHGAGWHEFEITVESNDPVEPAKKLYLSVDFYQSGKD